MQMRNLKERSFSQDMAPFVYEFDYSYELNTIMKIIEWLSIIYYYFEGLDIYLKLNESLWLDILRYIVVTRVFILSWLVDYLIVQRKLKRNKQIDIQGNNQITSNENAIVALRAR